MITSGLLGLALSVSLIVDHRILSGLTATLKHWPFSPYSGRNSSSCSRFFGFYAMHFMSEDLFRAFEYSYRTFSSASGIVIGSGLINSIQYNREDY